MKSITIDISEKAYKKFKNLLELLPKDSFIIYENDPDFLTAKEKEQYYKIQKNIKKGNYSEFDDWDNVKDDI